MRCEKRHLPRTLLVQGMPGKAQETAARKFLAWRKCPFWFLVPRNNKLSQVTAYLFLGPKGAAVSYFISITKTKKMHNVTTHSALYIIPFCPRRN
jgi:hypothetical protein